MGYIRSITYISLLAAFPAVSYAKPVSYAGGVMVMQENDQSGSSITVDYSPTAKMSVGAYSRFERGDEFSYHGLQISNLWKRWNLKEGQGNIYTILGGGVAEDNGNARPAGWASLMGDFETRRLFTSYELRGLYADDIETSASQRARVGVAPYLANYDEINPWLMLQIDHQPAKENNVVVTPLVRLFYRASLTEFGVSNHGDVMFNWTLQF